MILMIFPFMSAFGQQADGERRQRTDSTNRSMPGIGKVYGFVTDSLTGKPAEFASVALLRVRDSLPVAGVLADEKGSFTMTEVPFGRFILKISSIGFDDYASQPVAITPAQSDLDMGRIAIHARAKRLKEVEVAGEKSEYVNALDRKVYNLDKNIVNTGGTATEVLRNIPSVTVDMDGNISLRGSGNVNVLIDGKPSGITGSTRQAVLQQIPASSIERIEVITNPSAKYDADGMAGIINVVTKKDKLKGLNVNATVGVGTNEKYNAAVGGNFRTRKFNLYANYSYRHEKRTSTSESTRYNFYGDTAFYDLSQSHGTGINNAHVVKGGVDYFINDLTSIGLGATATFRKDSRPDYLNFQELNAERVIMNSYIRENQDRSDNTSLDGNLDFRKIFKKSKAEWTAGAQWSMGDRSGNDEYRDFTDAHVLTLTQYVNTENDNSVATFQTDFSYPFNESSKFETGWKSVIRKIDAESSGGIGTSIPGILLPDPRYIDHFIYDEQIHAIYALYTGRLGKFDYQAGVRGEDYLNQGNSETTQIDFNNEYLNVYPSAFLKYHISKSQETQLSYSRRVNRPESRSMNPFIDYSDPLNLRKGNPEVKPEYIDSYEWAYLKNFDKHSVNFTLYYRHTTNLISRFRFIDQQTNVTTSTFINYSSSENAGIEIVIKNQIGELINIMTSTNLFQNKINGSNIESELQSSSTNWNVRTTVNARIAKNTSLQVAAMYMAPAIQPQGSFKGLSGVDAGIRQEIWKGKASLGLNVNDIFNTRKMIIHNTGDGYVSDVTRTRESRVAMINFSYRFGSAEYNAKRKNQKNQNQLQPDQNNMMDDY